MVLPVEEGLQGTGYSGYDFVVRVNIGDTVGTVQPLCGVNKGVRAADGSCEFSSATQADFSALYTEFGVQSVRTHEGGYNISQLLWPSEDEVGAFSTHGGVSRYGTADQDVREIPETEMEPPFGYNSTSEALCGGEGQNLFLYPDFTIDGAGTPYFFWYPSVDIPHLFQRCLDQYIDLDSSGAGPGYRGLADADIEVYFRLGEGSRGPSYIGTPFEEATFSSEAKRCYAQIAARIVRDLAASCGQATIPGFVDLWNEAFTGPFHDDVSNTLALANWAADYATFFNAVHEALVSPDFPFVPFPQGLAGDEDIIDLSTVRFGGFSFLGGDMRRFADRVVDGDPTLNSRVHTLLSRIDREKLSFLSFHLYGHQQNDPLKTLFAWFHDLSRILEAVETFRVAQARPYDGLRFAHLSEWGYLLPKDDDGVAASVFGGSFVSAGLTWMQYAQSMFEGSVERAHLWGGVGRKTGIFSFARLRPEIPKNAPETNLFFIRASAVAMLFHSSIEGWDLLDTALIPGWGVVGPNPAWHDPFGAAEAKLDITALAASRSQGPVGSESHVVLLSNLTEGSKQVRVEIGGLSEGSYTATVSRTNESALAHAQSYKDLDTELPWESVVYKGHPVPADGLIQSDLGPYHVLSESAVSNALLDVLVVSQSEHAVDASGELRLDVEFPDDHGLMKIPPVPVPSTPL